jgi:hypothetical protein
VQAGCHAKAVVTHDDERDRAERSASIALGWIGQQKVRSAVRFEALSSA